MQAPPVELELESVCSVTHFFPYSISFFPEFLLRGGGLLEQGGPGHLPPNCKFGLVLDHQFSNPSYATDTDKTNYQCKLDSSLDAWPIDF